MCDKSVCGKIVSQLASLWHVARGRSFVNAERASDTHSSVYLKYDFIFACEFCGVRDLFDEAKNRLPDQSAR